MRLAPSAWLLPGLALEKSALPLPSQVLKNQLLLHCQSSVARVAVALPSLQPSIDLQCLLCTGFRISAGKAKAKQGPWTKPLVSQFKLGPLSIQSPLLKVLLLRHDPLFPLLLLSVVQVFSVAVKFYPSG